MKKRLSFILALLMLTTAILPACAPSEDEEPGTTEPGPDVAPEGMSVTSVEDVLTVAHRGEPILLDPQMHGDQASSFVVGQMYEALIRRNNETMEFEPVLAESWEQIDEITTRFHLKEGVLFHSGEELTAHDVKFSYDRGKTSAKRSFIFAAIDTENTVVVDDYTIDVKTYDPYAPLLNYIAHVGAMIISEKAVADSGLGDEFGREPIGGGTGPWVFKEWVAGDRIVFDRFEDYHQAPANFSQLVIRNITDDTTRALSLESGDIDIAMDVAPAQIERIDSSAEADVHRFPGFTTHYLCFNTAGDGPLSNVEVRRALYHAIDQPAMVQAAYGIIGQPADGIYPSNVTAYNEPGEGLTYEYDVEKAKQMLADAGYADGFEMKLWANENQTRIDLTEMLKNAWGQIGVDVTIEIMEFGVYLERTSAGEHDAFILGWVMGGNDGDFAYDNFRSTNGYNRNRGQYMNPEWDELMDKARVSTDPDERDALYAEAQDLLRRDLPWIPMCWTTVNYGLRSTLTGLDPDPEQVPRLYYIEPK